MQTQCGRITVNKKWLFDGSAHRYLENQRTRDIVTNFLKTPMSLLDDRDYRTGLWSKVSYRTQLRRDFLFGGDTDSVNSLNAYMRLQKSWFL